MAENCLNISSATLWASTNPVNSAWKSGNAFNTSAFSLADINCSNLSASIVLSVFFSFMTEPRKKSSWAADIVGPKSTVAASSNIAGTLPVWPPSLIANSSTVSGDAFSVAGLKYSSPAGPLPCAAAVALASSAIAVLPWASISLANSSRSSAKPLKASASSGLSRGSNLDVSPLALVEGDGSLATGPMSASDWPKRVMAWGITTSLGFCPSFTAFSVAHCEYAFAKSCCLTVSTLGPILSANSAPSLSSPMFKALLVSEPDIADSKTCSSRIAVPPVEAFSIASKLKYLVNLWFISALNLSAASNESPPFSYGIDFNSSIAELANSSNIPAWWKSLSAAAWRDAASIRDLNALTFLTVIGPSPLACW